MFEKTGYEFKPPKLPLKWLVSFIPPIPILSTSMLIYGELSVRFIIIALSSLVVSLIISCVNFTFQYYNKAFDEQRLSFDMESDRKLTGLERERLSLQDQSFLLETEHVVLRMEATGKPIPKETRQKIEKRTPSSTKKSKIICGKMTLKAIFLAFF